MDDFSFSQLTNPPVPQSPHPPSFIPQFSNAQFYALDPVTIKVTRKAIFVA